MRDYYARLRALDDAWQGGGGALLASADDARILRETAALVSAANARILTPAELDAAASGARSVRQGFSHSPAVDANRARTESDSTSEDEVSGTPLAAEEAPTPSSRPHREAPITPTPSPFLAWWRLFSSPTRDAGAAAIPAAAASTFMPPWHAELVNELRRDPAWATRHAKGASTVDYLLHKQQAAMASVLPVMLGLLQRGSATSSSAIADLALAFSFGCGITFQWSAWAWERLDVSHPNLLGAHTKAHSGLLFLGFRYSYWGDICRPLAEHLYRKTRSVIYAAKCGTLAGPDKIHCIVAPHEFCRVTEPDSERTGRVEFVAPRPASFTFLPRGERRISELNPLGSEIASGMVDLTGRASKAPSAAGVFAASMTGDVHSSGRPALPALPSGHRWLSTVLGSTSPPSDAPGTRIAASGLHVSVPTLVGETYGQRAQFEAAAALHFRRRRQLAIVSLFARQEVVHNAADLKRCLRALQDDPEPRSFLEILRSCMPYLRPPFKHVLRVPISTSRKSETSGVGSRDATEGDVFEELCLREAHEEASRPHVQQLLSIDDETTWFAQAAAASHGVFSALHRTTDYVRAEYHRATITKDDLSSERGHSNNQRKCMIDAIAGILYKILRKEIRYAAWPTIADASFHDAAKALALLRGDSTGAVDVAPRAVGATLRWGVLGAASIAPKFIASLDASRSSSLIAIASRDPARAAALLERVFSGCSYSREDRVGVLSSYEELLARTDVDAVYVPLPNHLHIEWAIKAVAAGKHVLVEKPMGVSASDVRLLRCAVEARRDRGQVLHVAEAMLPMYHTLLQDLRAEISRQGGAVRARIVYHHALSTDTIAYRSTEQGGGSLLALGCYSVALALALFGDLIPVAAAATPARRWSAAPDDPGTTPPDVSFLGVIAGLPGARSHAKLEGSTPVVTLSCSIDEGPSYQLLEIVCASGAKIDVPRPFRPGFDPLPVAFSRSARDTAAAMRVTPCGVEGTQNVMAASAMMDADALQMPYTQYLEAESAFTEQLRAFEMSALGGAPAAYSLADSEKAAALADALRIMSCSDRGMGF